MIGSMSLAWTLPCLMVAAAASAAQDDVVPVPGTRLRVTAAAVSPKPLVGTLVGITEREVVLALSASDRKTVPRADLTRLEWSQGRRGNAVKGLIVGAVLGAGILSAINAQDPETGDAKEYAVVALVGAGLGALPGAGVGALIKTERWAELPVAKLRVAVAPVRGRGVALNLAWRW
jgi:hypothetical protein